MREWIHSCTRPGAIVAVALCLAFPALWNTCFPEPAGAPVTVQLTRLRPQAEFVPPAGTIRAAVASGVGTPSKQALTFTFPLERAGRYSILGISSNRGAQPLALRVNGRPISATAFFQRTGSMRANFERHAIAHDVGFVAGKNAIAVAGARVRERTMLLELTPEAGLRPLRWLWLFALAAAALALRRWLYRRLSLVPPVRLAATSVLFIAGIALLPVAVARVTGEALVALGEKDPIKTRRLAFLEEHFATPRPLAAGDEEFEVFLMGDSTHYWSLPRKHWMQAELSRAFRRLGADDVELHGLAGGAMNAFDFYLLLNRVAPERPDLVVIPVGLRSFSDHWLHDEGYRFHEMDHYVGLPEFVRARNLAVAGRELSFVPWSLRRLDARFADGAVEKGLRGAKVYFEAERARLATRVAHALFPASAADPNPLQRPPGPRYKRWNTDIPDDHPLFEAYRLINALARRHGVRILYYAQQVDEQSQRRKGRDLRVLANFSTIERVIAGGPGVTFLMLAADNPPEIFSDGIDHLTPDGIAAVAAALAEEIASIAHGEAAVPGRRRRPGPGS